MNNLYFVTQIITKSMAFLFMCTTFTIAAQNQYQGREVHVVSPPTVDITIDESTLYTELNNFDFPENTNSLEIMSLNVYGEDTEDLDEDSFLFLETLVHLKTLIVKQETDTDPRAEVFELIIESISRNKTVKELALIHGFWRYNFDNLETLCTNGQLTYLHITGGLWYSEEDSAAISSEFSKLANLTSLTIKNDDNVFGDMGHGKTNFLRDNTKIVNIDFSSLYVTEDALENIVTCPYLKTLIFSFNSIYYEKHYDEYFTSSTEITRILKESTLDRSLNLTIYTVPRDIFNTGTLQERFPHANVITIDLPGE